MRKYFINIAKKLDSIIIFTILTCVFLYVFSYYFNQPEFKKAVEQETGIPGIYEFIYTIMIFLVLPMAYFMTKGYSFGFFTVIRNECFKNGDVVLVEYPKNKKMYAASVILNQDYIKEPNKINISIYDGEVIKIPSDNILRILDN